MHSPSEHLVHIIRPYIDKHLPQLAEDFQWGFREDVLFHHTGLTIEPGTWLARTLALKQAMHIAWCDADEHARVALAAYFVRIWGGIRGIGDQTLEEHTARVSRSPLECGFEGVPSWSKIACISNPARFPIFDARVACSLQALQFLAPDAGERYVFPAMSSRNAVIKVFAPEARLAGMRAGWRPLEKPVVYAVFLEALEEATVHIKEPLRMAMAEMLLFAHAERLARSARSVIRGEAQAQ